MKFWTQLQVSSFLRFSPCCSRARGVIAVFGLLSILGCHTAEVVRQSDSKGSGVVKPVYDALVLNYETKDLGKLFSRIKNCSVATGLTSRLSSCEQSPEEEFLEDSGPNGKWCQARIQIVYPHPDGSEDKGLARLIVSRHCSQNSAPRKTGKKLKNKLSNLMLRASGTSPELSQALNHKESDSKTEDEEIWQLNLPKEELDILLAELSHRGFFNQQERPRGEAKVTITVDQGELSKRWTSEPRLEDLMQQIYKEGQLSAFNTQGSKIHSVSATRSKDVPLKG